MSWRHIARVDIRELLRARLLWLGTLIIMSLAAVGAAIPYLTGGEASYTVAVEIGYITVALLTQFVAFGLGYSAVVGERESGSMRFLLGLPNSRADIIIAKSVSRSAVAVAITVAGIVGVLVTAAVLYPGFSLAEPFLVMLSVVLIVIIYTVLSVAISASVNSGTKAIAGVFSAYIVVFFLWNFIARGIHWAIAGTVPGDPPHAAWYVFLKLLNPGNAIEQFTYAGISWMQNGDFVSVAPVAESITGPVPFYLSKPMAVLIAIVWLVGPLYLGYNRFQKAEPK